MAARVLVRTTGLPREEWLQARRQGIGSSDAPAVCGLDPYRKPVQVYLDKLGLEPDRSDSEAAEWGRLLEDVIAGEFARRTGKKVRRFNAILQHEAYPWMLAEPDREVVGGALLEVKTTGAGRLNEWENDQVPERVMVQVQHQLEVTGADLAYLAVLIGGQRLLIREVWPDKELAKALVQIEDRFWNGHVVPRVPPPPDDSEAYSRAMAALYPGQAGATVELPPEASPLIDLYRNAQGLLRYWEQAKQRAENALKAMMGNATIGLVGGKPVVRWTRFTTKVLDQKALCEAYPEILASFTREEPRQRFSLIGKGDE